MRRIAGPRAHLAVGQLEERANPSVVVTTDVTYASPRVQSFSVNDGAIQRSKVGSLEVVFNQYINFPTNPNEAICVIKLTPGTNAVTEVPLPAPDVWTNSSGNSVVRYVGPTSTSDIITDGDYKILIKFSQTVGGQVNDPDEMLGAFHHLYGDVDGNRTVNFTDFLAFRNVYGTDRTMAEFLDYLDFNSDGNINQVDFAAFRNNFGITL